MWPILALLACDPSGEPEDDRPVAVAPGPTSPTTPPAPVDADEDGVTEDADCDDADPLLPSTDADCDGTPTDADCDDTDPLLPSTDADCDGTPTDADCDDADPLLPSTDADCDGTLTDADCDDTDPLLPSTDLDCDGVATADDCDDADPIAPLGDLDCDGVPTAEDCDDTDPTLPATDGDCDGIPTGPDCDDADPAVADVASEARSVSEVGLDFVELCAHGFPMGCTPGQSGCEVDESPVVDVTLTHATRIGRTEVTQAEYAAVMGDNPAWFGFCGPTCPVEYLTWSMAAAFTNALSAQEGRTACYACTGAGDAVECSVAVEPHLCDGYRLPTEAEWEAAARCGQDLPYAGSASAGTVAWYASNSSSTAHGVAAKGENACGFVDQSGNVWEWTQDWYGSGYYGISPGVDPVGPASGGYRVARGGGWSSGVDDLRISERNGAVPSTRKADVGFRVARTVP